MLRIQPDEGISIEFETKVPGTSMQTSTVHMDFCYEREFNVPAPVAYETLSAGCHARRRHPVHASR